MVLHYLLPGEQVKYKFHVTLIVTWAAHRSSGPGPSRTVFAKRTIVKAASFGCSSLVEVYTTVVSYTSHLDTAVNWRLRQNKCHRQSSSGSVPHLRARVQAQELFSQPHPLLHTSTTLLARPTCLNRNVSPSLKAANASTSLRAVSSPPTMPIKPSRSGENNPTTPPRIPHHLRPPTPSPVNKLPSSQPPYHTSPSTVSVSNP